jgi:putative nucleotidyltransferase with HDIG domain
MIDKIKSMVLELCKGKDWDWKAHIESVVKYSKILADKLDADAEVVEIAAWLHDIKKLKGEKKDHHIHGAEEAGEILKKLDYPEEKIDDIKYCILTHSSDELYLPETKEAKILASADALSHFDNFAALAYGFFGQKKLNIAEGRKALIEKYDSCWKKIMPEARYLAKERYEAIMLILAAK